MKKCRNCGFELADGMNFCPQCHAKYEVPASAPMRKCRSCGAVLEDGVNFCPQCHAKFEPQLQSEPAAQEPSPSASPDGGESRGLNVEELLGVGGGILVIAAHCLTKYVFRCPGWVTWVVPLGLIAVFGVIYTVIKGSKVEREK